MGRGMVRRGLRAPMLVVTDGAPGLIRVMEELWPDSDRQRWTVHRDLLGRARRGHLAGGWRGQAAPAGRRPGARVPERSPLPGRRPADPLRAPRVPAPSPLAAALDKPAGALTGGGEAADEGGARPVHRQRSRARPHRAGALTAGANARRPDGPGAGRTD